MALRVLTDDERINLLADPNFKAKCGFAAEKYANYWAANDGSAASTLAERIKWAKDRQLGVDILSNGLNDDVVDKKFLRVSQAMQIDLGNAPETSTAIISAMESGGKFDEATSLYFDLKGESLNFTFGGN